MNATRRRLLLGLSAAVASVSLDAAGRRPRILLFDGLVLLDLSPIAARLESAFPGRGAELARALRVRVFEYTWLRASAERYRDFSAVAEEALIYVARAAKVELGAGTRADVLAALQALDVYPDVEPCLLRLKEHGCRSAVLSNLTPRMLESGLSRGGLASRLAAVISTDSARTYKPHPRAYQLGVRRLRARREDVLFVASASWDAAGARWFGYRACWINRGAEPSEGLQPDLEAALPDLGALVAFVEKQRG